MYFVHVSLVHVSLVHVTRITVLPLFAEYI